MLSSVIQFHEIPNQFEITLMNCMEPFCLYILDVLDKVQKKKKNCNECGFMVMKEHVAQCLQEEKSELSLIEVYGTAE